MLSIFRSEALFGHPVKYFEHTEWTQCAQKCLVVMCKMCIITPIVFCLLSVNSIWAKEMCIYVCAPWISLISEVSAFAVCCIQVNYRVVVHVNPFKHVILATNVANNWESDECNKQLKFLFVLLFRVCSAHSVCVEHYVASEYAALHANIYFWNLLFSAFRLECTLFVRTDILFWLKISKKVIKITSKKANWSTNFINNSSLNNY